MLIKKNISLKHLNTFGMDVKAKEFASVGSELDLAKVLAINSSNLLVLGGGSNMLLTEDPDALVLHINIKGIEVVSIFKNNIRVKVAAGENWHDFVSWSLKKNYGGIENLSLIPGNVGTAPIQNIGAYGVELKDVFVSCEAMDIKTQEQRTFVKDDCNFGYRNSIFKEELKDKYIITSVIFELSTLHHKLKKNYGTIENELKNIGIDNPTIQDISKAVISIRNSKLPNPKVIGNSGSFFKNPIISIERFKVLTNKFPKIPHYKFTESSVKVPAGWLIEVAGFKGKRIGNYGVHEKQALVLVNYGNASGKDILELSKKIQEAILIIFDIVLESEVNIL